MGKSIIIAVIAGTMGISLLSLSTSRSLFDSERSVASYQEDILSREIAHTAQNRAMHQLENNFNWRDGYSSVGYQGGVYSVNVTEGDDGRIRVLTTSNYAGSTYEIRSVVSPRYLEGSVIANIPDAVAAYNGNSFTISGEDINSAGEPGPGPSIHAITASTKAVADIFKDAIGNNQANNLTGALGPGDVVHNPTHHDLDELHEYLKANATPGYVFDGDQKFTGNTTFGSPEEPVIMVVNGDADFAGTITGYGVLLVEGELQIAAGNVTWEGLVFVNGQEDAMVTHTTSDITGNAKIFGGLIMRLPNSGNHTLGFSIKGHASIQYSTEALARVASIVPPIKNNLELILLSQWEGHTTGVQDEV